MKGILFFALIPAAFLAAACASAPVERQPQTIAAADVPAGEWFQQTGCTACHSVSAYHLWNLAAQGPDLSLAVEDVPRRFGRPLDEFLHDPTGTMAMVLATRIPLNTEQRNVAITKLREAYRVHLASTGSSRPVTSH